MSARANQQQTKAAATKRTARSTQGARGDKSKNIVTETQELPRRRATDLIGHEPPKFGRRSTDRGPEPEVTANGEKEQKGRKNSNKKVLTIGDFVTSLLMGNKSTDEILKAVEKKFPGCKTSRSSVAWYRSRLNKQGKQ